MNESISLLRSNHDYNSWWLKERLNKHLLPHTIKTQLTARRGVLHIYCSLGLCSEQERQFGDWAAKCPSYKHMPAARPAIVASCGTKEEEMFSCGAARSVDVLLSTLFPLKFHFFQESSRDNL